MKHMIALLLLLMPAFARAADKPKGFEAFQLIRSRNIFDPNRKPPKKESDLARPVAPSRPKSVHLDLTGTMVTDSRALAFFTGSRSEFNKIVSVGEKVGDFTVAAIAADHVNLDQIGKPVSITVGKRLQLDGTEADSAEAEIAPASPDVSPTAPATTGASPPASAPTGGNSPSDVLKRMMERRAKEMKK